MQLSNLWIDFIPFTGNCKTIQSARSMKKYIKYPKCSAFQNT